MSARAIASTTISFGLVTVPVRLYASGRTGSRVSFNLVHRECGTRLRQQYVCPTCEEVVEKDDIVKGYEFAKGQYVLFEPEELEAIETPATEGIEISEFVDADEVDPVFFDRPYYLGPDKGGARAYRLLAEALRETGKVAIGQYSARGKAYLVMVRPVEDGLVMEQLRYAEEVRPFSEVPRDEVEVKEEELDLARKLIEQSASEAFDPDRYRDVVREQMLEMIERKVAGEEIVAAPSVEAEPQIIDLMSALKASLEEEGTRKPAARVAEKGKKKAASGKARKKKKTASR